MRFVGLISIFFVLNIFSCRTSENKDKPKTEDTTVITNDKIDAEGPVTITGRIKIGSEGSHPASHFAIIEDENGTQYSVYPSEIGEELKNYQGRLIKFTVITLNDETRGTGGSRFRGRTVTPISWEIIEGPPVVPPKIISLGVIQVKGVVNIYRASHGGTCNVVSGTERWQISSGEIDRIYDLNGYTVTVEGEGTVTEPITPSISRFDVDKNTMSEEERDSLIERDRRRKLSNVRIILIHNITDHI